MYMLLYFSVVLWQIHTASPGIYANWNRKFRRKIRVAMFLNLLQKVRFPFCSGKLTSTLMQAPSLAAFSFGMFFLEAYNYIFAHLHIHSLTHSIVLTHFPSHTIIHFVSQLHKYLFIHSPTHLLHILGHFMEGVILYHIPLNIKVNNCSLIFSNMKMNLVGHYIAVGQWWFFFSNCIGLVRSVQFKKLRYSQFCPCHKFLVTFHLEFPLCPNGYEESTFLLCLLLAYPLTVPLKGLLGICIPAKRNSYWSRNFISKNLRR